MKDFLLGCLKLITVLYMAAVVIIGVIIDGLLTLIFGPNAISEWLEKEYTGIEKMMCKLSDVDYDEIIRGS